MIFQHSDITPYRLVYNENIDRTKIRSVTQSQDETTLNYVCLH